VPLSKQRIIVCWLTLQILAASPVVKTVFVDMAATILLIDGGLATGTAPSPGTNTLAQKTQIPDPPWKPRRASPKTPFLNKTSRQSQTAQFTEPRYLAILRVSARITKLHSAANYIGAPKRVKIDLICAKPGSTIICDAGCIFGSSLRTFRKLGSWAVLGTTGRSFDRRTVMRRHGLNAQMANLGNCRRWDRV
jgi:hypothetical protein